MAHSLLRTPFFLFPLFTLAAAPGHRLTTEGKSIPLKAEKFLETKIDFGAGELNAHPNVSSGKLFEGHLSYRPSHPEPEFHYSASGPNGYLTLETHSLKKFFSEGDSKNGWEISFSPKVTHSFDIDLGACKANLDFTALPVEDLKLDLGAGECRVRFDRPNPVEMGKLDISAGASELTVEGLGNARFKKLKFDGGMGSFKLDFSGRAQGDRQAKISVGMGSIEIIFPPDLGVRVYKESGLSSVDFDPDLEKVGDDTYESSNYRSAKSRLIINLSVGLGSAELRRAESNF